MFRNFKSSTNIPQHVTMTFEVPDGPKAGTWGFRGYELSETRPGGTASTQWQFQGAWEMVIERIGMEQDDAHAAAEEWLQAISS